MITLFERQLKEYKRAIRLKRQVESIPNLRGTKTLIRDLTRLINRFIKNNPRYIEYKKLSSKYNRLRYGVNRVNPQYIKIKNYFSTNRIINNPFESYSGLSPISFSKTSNKELEINITSLNKVFEDTQTSPSSKYNSIKILLNITFNKDNFWDILDSDQKSAIRKDEDETGMVSDLRFSYTIQNLNEIIKGNSEFNYDKIKNKKSLTRLIKKQYFGSDFQSTLNNNPSFSWSDKTDKELLEMFEMLME